MFYYSFAIVCLLLSKLFSKKDGFNHDIWVYDIMRCVLRSD